MTGNEQAIRDLVSQWFTAGKAGDLETVLGLMADDVLFLVPGKEPFGKREFAASSTAMKGVRIDGVSEIVELEVLGGRAWMRCRLEVRMTPPGGAPMVRSGYTLTVLRKDPDGRWVILRDANLLGPPG